MQTQSRVVGSGFTTLLWNGNALGWLDRFTDTGQSAVGGSGQQGYDVVLPIGAPAPTEIVTSRVLDVGTITFSIKELWPSPAWQQLQGIAVDPVTGVPTSNIVDVFRAQADTPGALSVQLIIKPPGSAAWRGWTYNNVTVVGIGDGESVQTGTLTMNRTISALYTQRISLTTSGTPIY